MKNTRDPLYHGDEARKAWEEFRVVFSAAFQHLWLLDELSFIAPNYSEALEARFQTGFYTSELLAEEDPDHDGSVPVSDPNEERMDWFDKESAELVYEQLFPHGRSEADQMTRAYGMALVGLHSALETYAKAIGIPTRGSLPRNLRDFLVSRGGDDLDAGTADLITDVDATRHIIVHNRGIVDDVYINKVKDNRFTPGEYHPLKAGAVHESAQAIWRTALRLRDAAAAGR